MHYKDYNDKLAEEYVWGDVREVSLAENIYSLLSKNPKQIIEIGCGDGYLLYYLLKRLKCEFIGFDLSKLRLNRLKKALPSVKCIEGDITKYSFEDNEFETVICSEVLEHIPNFKKALDELIRITDKELIITVPNDQWLKKTFCPKCGAKHYVDGHINKFNPKNLRELLKNHRRVIENIKIRKFHTIYSYNQTTLKLPVIVRFLFDQVFVKLEKYFSFFKPNYLLIKIIKKEIL